MTKSLLITLFLILIATPFILTNKQIFKPFAATTTTSPCQFQKADPGYNIAFCDTFDAPTNTPGNRSGDMNGLIWGVSRINTATNPSQGENNTWAPTQIQKCGATPIVLPDNDVVICNGQLIEAVNDGGSLTGVPIPRSGQETGNIGNNLSILAMYPKQPFDIAGRTGTVTFDVTADSQGGHAAWPTFVYTDKPVPAPYSSASATNPNARNSFGFTLDGYGNTPDNQYIGGNCPNTNDTSVGSMFITRDYALSNVPFTILDCVKRPNVPGQDADTSTLRGPLNHFELRISQSHIEVWGSDPGATTLKELAVADNVNLPLTRGLIWIEDVHYNACKFNSQCVHSFAWDNVGFDGPYTYNDLAFDALENNEKWNGGPAVNLGWAAPFNSGTKVVQVPGLFNISKATGANVTFNWFPMNLVVPSIRVNGGPWHDTAWPFTSGDATGGYSWRTIAVPVPLTELVAGTNTVEFKTADSVNGAGESFANVDIILVAAGAGCTNPSNCSGTTVTGIPPTVSLFPSPSSVVSVSPSVSLTPSPSVSPSPSPSLSPSVSPSPIPMPKTASITVLPGAQSVQSGGTFSVMVHVTTPANNPMNSAQAVVTYSTGQLQLTSIDDTSMTSPFTIKVQETDTSGTVTLVRGATTPLTGENHLVTLQFKVIGTTAGVATIAVTNASRVISSMSNTDILGTSSNGVITITTGKIGDLNNDSKIDIFDLSILLSNWSTTNAVGDVNHDGKVDIIDLSTLLTHWGQ